MKKIVALLLIIGCLVTVLSLPVGAASSNNEVDFIVKADGENITVDVKTNFACGGLQGTLNYDVEKIAYNNINFETAINSKNKANDSIKNVDGATKFAFVGDVKDGTTGKWSTILYNGTKPKFNVSNLKAYAANGTKIDANVYVVFRGDANVDGEFDIRDLVRLKKIAVGSSNIVEQYKKNLDIDSNGVWEPAADLTAFRKYLLGVYELN